VIVRKEFSSNLFNNIAEFVLRGTISHLIYKA